MPVAEDMSDIFHGFLEKIWSGVVPDCIDS